MEDKAGHTAYASYSSFSLDSEASLYTLLLGSYTGGTAGQYSTGNHDYISIAIFHVTHTLPVSIVMIIMILFI